ncbi:MAG: ribulose bisphosphate carboxylase small subunit [Candidatus Eremiobacteraeota bacterium]|nr:ribulose bisphosphate carboxylase small subunit [Candidatus Eremiobacteraeota bacterium]
MRLTQGQFSFLPDLTEEQIKKQVQYALDHGWPISIEYTDDPHPRNSYWEMHGLPMFDVKDAVAIVGEITKAVEKYPNSYVKVNAYDARLGRQTTAMSFIVGRPANEPGFRLDRTAWEDRQIKYSIHSYAVEEPVGERYKK